MKLRGSFVSNSSSSSFIVAIPRGIYGASDLRKLLFGEDAELKHKYTDKVWDTQTVAETIYAAKLLWDSIVPQLSIEQIYNIFIDEMFSGGVEDISACIDYDDMTSFEVYKKKCQKKLDSFLDKHRGEDVVMLKFGDDYGVLLGAIELQDVLKPLDHIRILKR